jgi:hypothetical protein
MKQESVSKANTSYCIVSVCAQMQRAQEEIARVSAQRDRYRAQAFRSRPAIAAGRSFGGCQLDKIRSLSHQHLFSCKVSASRLHISLPLPFPAASFVFDNFI